MNGLNTNTPTISLCHEKSGNFRLFVGPEGKVGKFPTFRFTSFCSNKSKSHLKRLHVEWSPTKRRENRERGESQRELSTTSFCQRTASASFETRRKVSRSCSLSPESFQSALSPRTSYIGRSPNVRNLLTFQIL